MGSEMCIRDRVELVDLYPTLADVCGLDIPKGLEGTSLRPLLDEPGRDWKLAAFSQYPRAFTGTRHRGHSDIMGYTIRTAGHRYVEWREWKTRKVIARELYDHQVDPQEMRNLHGEASYGEVLRRHRDILAAGWRGARPAAAERGAPGAP